jgi:hypothetical protein
MSEDRRAPGVVMGIIELLAQLAFGLGPIGEHGRRNQYSYKRKDKPDPNQLIDRKETFDTIEREDIQNES